MALQLRDQHIFMVKITEDFEHFQCFIFETSFMKNENVFEKLDYHFLDESTTRERELFPYKTTLSKINVETE